MSSHPRIPMRIAGGRPLPGSVRSHSSSAFGSRNLSRLRSPTPEPNPATTLGHQVEGGDPFTFGDAQASASRGMPRPNQIQFGITDAPNPGPSGGLPPPTFSPLAMREQLYGAVTISQRGSVAFQPTRRFNHWLSGLYNADTTTTVPEPIDLGDECPNEDKGKTEKVTAGMKRRTLVSYTLLGLGNKTSC